MTAVFDTTDVVISRSYGITRDAVFEPNETATLTISGTGANPCVIADGVATGIIINDDPGVSPRLSVADTSVVEGTGAGTTTLNFAVTAEFLQPADCTFRAVLTHGTTNDADYTFTGFFDVTVVWDIDDVAIPRSFGVTRDPVFEPNETMTLTISGTGVNPCAIGDGVATGTIINDEPLPPPLSVADASVAEGTGAGTSSLAFAVSAGPQPIDCGFQAVMKHGTTNDADFVSTASFDVTGVFGTTDVSLQRTFEIARDAILEPDETVRFTISGDPSHVNPCQIADGGATGTITNDDSAAPPLSVADASVAEGTGAGTTSLVFAVSAGRQPIDCGFRVVVTHGTTTNADFTSTASFNVTGVFGTADVSLPRSFGVALDTVFEPNETVTLTISGDASHPYPCTIADGVASGTITNDDLRPRGHTHVYWRTHVRQWPARHSPRMSLTRAGFAVPRCSGFRRLDLTRPAGTDTLLHALKYKGGAGLTGRGRILVRSAAAALAERGEVRRRVQGLPKPRGPDAGGEPDSGHV